MSCPTILDFGEPSVDMGCWVSPGSVRKRSAKGSVTAFAFRKKGSESEMRQSTLLEVWFAPRKVSDISLTRHSAATFDHLPDEIRRLIMMYRASQIVDALHTRCRYLARCKKNWLRVLCKMRSLPVSGTKNKLQMQLSKQLMLQFRERMCLSEKFWRS